MRINAVYFSRKLRQLIEITDKEAPPKEIGNKELEVLKQQLDNLEKDHQKQVEALQSKMEESELKATATSKQDALRSVNSLGLYNYAHYCTTYEVGSTFRI